MSKGTAIIGAVAWTYYFLKDNGLKNRAKNGEIEKIWEKEHLKEYLI